MDVTLGYFQYHIHLSLLIVIAPMHLQPVFAEYDFISVVDGDVSVGEDIFNRGLCLPSDIKNTEEDMQNIINIVRGCFGR